jgi:hypothetical protein
MGFHHGTGGFARLQAAAGGKPVIAIAAVDDSLPLPTGVGFFLSQTG